MVFTKLESWNVQKEQYEYYFCKSISSNNYILYIDNFVIEYLYVHCYRNLMYNLFTV